MVFVTLHLYSSGHRGKHVAAPTKLPRAGLKVRCGSVARGHSKNQELLTSPRTPRLGSALQRPLAALNRTGDCDTGSVIVACPICDGDSVVAVPGPGMWLRLKFGCSSMPNGGRAKLASGGATNQSIRRPPRWASRRNVADEKSKPALEVFAVGTPDSTHLSLIQERSDDDPSRRGLKWGLCCMLRTGAII
jgi:hypothetical protein